jgi:hypothetical protein
LTFHGKNETAGAARRPRSWKWHPENEKFSKLYIYFNGGIFWYFICIHVLLLGETKKHIIFCFVLLLLLFFLLRIMNNNIFGSVLSLSTNDRYFAANGSLVCRQRLADFDSNHTTKEPFAQEPAGSTAKVEVIPSQSEIQGSRFRIPSDLGSVYLKSGTDVPGSITVPSGATWTKAADQYEMFPNGNVFLTSAWHGLQKMAFAIMDVSGCALNPMGLNSFGHLKKYIKGYSNALKKASNGHVALGEVYLLRPIISSPCKYTMKHGGITADIDATKTCGDIQWVSLVREAHRGTMASGGTVPIVDDPSVIKVIFSKKKMPNCPSGRATPNYSGGKLLSSWIHLWTTSTEIFLHETFHMGGAGHSWAVISQRAGEGEKRVEAALGAGRQFNAREVDYDDTCVMQPGGVFTSRSPTVSWKYLLGFMDKPTYVDLDAICFDAANNRNSGTKIGTREVVVQDVARTCLVLYCGAILVKRDKPGAPIKYTGIVPYPAYVIWFRKGRLRCEIYYPGGGVTVPKTIEIAMASSTAVINKPGLKAGDQFKLPNKWLDGLPLLFSIGTYHSPPAQDLQAPKTLEALGFTQPTRSPLRALSITVTNVDAKGATLRLSPI